MKKYIKPVINSQCVKISNIICGSPELNNSGTGADQLVNGREDLVSEFDLDW